MTKIEGEGTHKVDEYMYIYMYREITERKNR